MFWVSHSYNIPKLSFLKHFYGNKQFWGWLPSSSMGLVKTSQVIQQSSVFFPPCISACWCNNHLEKYEFVNGKDDIPYMKWKTTCSKQPTIYIYIYIRAIIDVVCGSCVARHIIHSIIEIWAWPQKPWRKNRSFFNPKEGENRPLTNLDQLGPTYT